jgi:hypothetical protein
MSTTPYAAPQSHVADIETREGLEVTWGRATRVWWSIMWRTVVVSFLAAFALGVIVGVVGAASGLPAGFVRGASTLIGVVIGLTVSIWAVKKGLTRSFADFRVVLLPKQA